MRAERLSAHKIGSHKICTTLPYRLACHVNFQKKISYQFRCIHRICLSFPMLFLPRPKSLTTDYINQITTTTTKVTKVSAGRLADDEGKSTLKRVYWMNMMWMRGVRWRHCERCDKIAKHLNGKCRLFRIQGSSKCTFCDENYVAEC